MTTRTRSTCSRGARLALVASTGLAAVLLGAGPSRAADDGDLAHAEVRKDQVRLLVDVPESVTADLDAVTVAVDGDELDATARAAGTDTVVRRTTILAIDTSDSMEGARFAAAQDAARTFVETAPGDVRIGIVTFDGQVEAALAPTTDREQALTTIDGLTLDQGTLLHDGVLTALAEAGRDGERSLLVISDGADTSETPLGDVTAAIERSETTVQVVALDQDGEDLAALEELAAAGGGAVVEADPESLTSTFSAQADVLARQVLVSAPVPSSGAGGQATVTVELPTSGETVTGSALVRLRATADSDEPAVAPAAPTDDAWQGPRWLMWAGIGAVAVGLFVSIALLSTGRERVMTADERVAAYTAAGRRMKQPEAGPNGHRAETTMPTALGAMSGVLERNRGLEDKIDRRLMAAGSALKPSEWLLVHVGVFILSGIVGFFVGGGSLLLGVLFLLAGAVLPRVWLSLRASRRRKKFSTQMPDTLQLMSGSLAAGLSLMQSVDTIVREGREPVRSEFKRVLVETRLGVSLEDALDGVAERFDSKDWAWVVMAIRIQRTVGGNLAELLETVGGTIREREFLRRQVAALSAEGKLSALILSALPPGIFLFVFMTNRPFVEPLFNTGIGVLMALGATAWLSLGIFWMSRMVKVEV